jgi:hypothetical protein
MNVYSCCSPLLSEQSIITGPTYLKEVVDHHQNLSSCAYVSGNRKTNEEGSRSYSLGIMIVAMTVGSQQAVTRFPVFKDKAAGFSICTLLDKTI